MNEIDQLKCILEESDFWQQEDFASNRIQVSGGVNIEIIGEANEFQWRARVSERETMSNKTFRTRQEAKRDIRAFLTNRLENLLDIAVGPANCDL